MMVGNDIRHDTRVLKTALALADGGVEVTILGYSSSGAREETRLGPVRMLRVPVAWRFRDRANAAKKAWRDQRWIGEGPTPRDLRLRSLQLGLRKREAAEQGTAEAAKRAEEAEKADERALKRDERRAEWAKREEHWRTKLYEKIDNSTWRASWRADAPEMDDYALAFDPMIDSLDWDVLHAHDVHMVGIASRAVARRRAQGRPAAWVYDAHEYVKGLSVYPPRTRRKVAAYLDLEAEYVRDADAVITVTQPLAEVLQKQYQLPRTPAVVMNAPVLGAASLPTDTTLREACGLADDVPLLVYSGGVTVARGIDTAVAALPHLEGVHLAVVAVPHTRVAPAQALKQQAEELGVADRLHLVEPVRPEEVSSFVASADVGIIPILHFGSHEVALANKLFEYLYANVPVLVSDCKAQKEFVEREKVGAVHEAGNPASFAAGVREVLNHAAALRERIRSNPDLLEPYAWEHQEKTLRETYRELYRAGLPGGAEVERASGDAGITEPAAPSTLDQMTERPIDRDDQVSVVGIGPANMAGQAWEWAKALERNLPGVKTHVMVVDRGQKFRYPDDEWVEITKYRRNVRWAQDFENRAITGWTHALFEAGRPLFGLRHGDDFVGDAKVLRGAGVRVGMLLHGSEVRNPVINVMQTPWSPFSARKDEQTVRLQKGVDLLVPKLRAFMDDATGGGPVFVSTPDLLRHLPGSIWCPVVVDVEKWAYDGPLLEREKPVVLHAPSRSSLKGSDYVETAIAPLVSEGLVEYRRVEGVTHEAMVDLVKEADVVLDQFALGLYGVAACEAMMAGRLVVSHVTDEVRNHVSEATGATPPIYEAPANELEGVLREVLADRDRFREFAAAGPEFVKDVHDGRRSAAVLAEHMNIHGE